MKKMFLMLGCLLPLQMQAYIEVGKLSDAYESNYDYLSKKLTIQKDGKNKEPNTTITKEDKKGIGTDIRDRILAKIASIEEEIKKLEENGQVNQEQCLKFLEKGGLVNLFFHVIEKVKLLDKDGKECVYRCFCENFVPVDRGTNHSLADENSSRDVKYFFSLYNGVVNCFEFASPVYYDQLNPGNYIVQDGKIIQRQQNQKQLNEEFITLNDISEPFTEYWNTLDQIKQNFWVCWIKELCETLNNKLGKVEFDQANDENREAKKNQAIRETISDMSKYTKDTTEKKKVRGKTEQKKVSDKTEKKKVRGKTEKKKGSDKTEEKKGSDKTEENKGSDKTEENKVSGKKNEKKNKGERVKARKEIAQEILNDLKNIEKKIGIEDTLRSMQINTNKRVTSNMQAFEVPQKIELDNGDFGKIIKELKKYIDRLKPIFSNGKVTDFSFTPPKETENTNDQGEGTNTDNKVEDNKTENAEVKLDSYCITITYNSKKYQIFIKTDSSDEYKQSIRISTVMRNDNETNN